MNSASRSMTAVGSVLVLVSFPAWTSVADEFRVPFEPPQNINVPFRLFRTQNMWNQLLLDTRNGRVWQIAYGVDPNAPRLKVPINLKPLVIGLEPPIGRFTLYPTDNIWTFLLLDQADGRVWQCQFSTDEGGQFLLPIKDIPAQ